MSSTLQKVMDVRGRTSSQAAAVSLPSVVGESGRRPGGGNSAVYHIRVAEDELENASRQEQDDEDGEDYGHRGRC